MRKRIQKLAMGEFEHEEPVLALSIEKIEIEVLEGQAYEGDFRITSRNRIELRGLVYSSNPHMEVLTPQFKGEEVRISFQFHSEGFVEGDIQKGEFTIISNESEYNLSFVVSILRRYADSSIGKIASLYDFARLAQADYREAYRLFTSPRFVGLMRPDEGTARLLYEGLSIPPAAITNMEEFLVAVKRKQAIRFQLEKKRFDFEAVKDNQKETVAVKKDNWGFLEITITSDADFLIPDKTRVTTEDFVGSICKLEYLIEPSKLHAGKNFGRLIFKNAYQQENVEVVVDQKNKSASGYKNHLQMQHGFVELTEIYLEYRLKKIGGAMWAARTVGILNHLIIVGGGNDWFTLMKAQAFLTSGQRQEAAWILEEFKRKQEDKTVPIYGYYLYLCTLLEREPSYVNRLAKQIEEIFYRHEESNELFWILLFVKRDFYDNDTAKLRVLEERITEYSASPYFYLEAWYIYWQNPYLLTKLTDFTIHVLYWAGKRGALTGDLAIAISSLANGNRKFHPLFYQVLVFLYEKYEKPEMLAAICSYLVRAGRFSPEYHRWYELGVEADLQITGLNEAFLMSIDKQKVQTIPKVVQMYFRYNTNIPYKQKAALLVNIIAAKDKEPSVYRSYHEIMETFALEQIQEGHMDDNLAVVYSETLDKGMIKKQMVPTLVKILYTHKLTVFDEFSRVIIIHKQLKEVQTVPIIQRTAYFQLYAGDYVIVLEDAEGRKYGAADYQLERLINQGQYLRKCLEFAPYETAFLMQYFSGREKSTAFMPDDKNYLIQLLNSRQLREEYKAKLYPEIIRFLDRMDEAELVEKYLEQVPIGKCDREARIYLMEELINYHQYDLAYECIHQYGAVNINPAKLVPLCSYEIEECDDEEDEFLINLASYVFMQGKYNTAILDYLQKYYGGTTKSMKKLWQACYAFDIDTFGLEERLLVQMLYTTEFVDGVEEIYENYKSHGGLELVREAYLYYFSYSYLVNQTVVPEHVFSEIMQRIYDQKEVPDVGRLALLSYFAEENEWTEEKLEVTTDLLAEYVERGMYFGFYRLFPERIKYRFQFYDKLFLEYRTDPNKRVVLHYRMDTGSPHFVNEEMDDMFEGIFVKEFALFFGEEVEYYITEEDSVGSQAMEISTLTCRDVLNPAGTSRYEMLNAMIFSDTLGEESGLQELICQFERREKINKKLFQMI